MIYTNISNLCQKNGISIARLERETGLGNATVRGWGSSSPTVEKLKLVADFFGVTVNDLLSDSKEQGQDTTHPVPKNGQ